MNDVLELRCHLEQMAITKEMMFGVLILAVIEGVLIWEKLTLIR